MATWAQLKRVTKARGDVNAAWHALAMAVLEADELSLPLNVLYAVDDYRTARSEAASMEHTPIPWRVRETVTSNQIISADGAVTANAAWCPAMEANAAFIVQAVNAHQALVEALEEALSELETIDSNLADGRETYVSGTRLELVRAALRQARGEELAS